MQFPKLVRQEKFKINYKSGISEYVWAESMLIERDTKTDGVVSLSIKEFSCPAPIYFGIIAIESVWKTNKTRYAFV